MPGSYQYLTSETGLKVSRGEYVSEVSEAHRIKSANSKSTNARGKNGQTSPLIENPEIWAVLMSSHSAKHSTR